MRYFPLKYLFFLAGLLGCMLTVHKAASQPVKTLADSLIVLSEIKFSGNKVTKERIMLRELTVAAGDTIPKDKLPGLIHDSRENLLNTSLFNFVDISIAEAGPQQVSLKVDVTERWYIWPRLLLDLGDRNFNVWWETRRLDKLSYGVAVDWSNFRGRRETLTASVRLGYEQMFGFTYQVPYINRGQTLGLGFGAGFEGHHELPYITFHNLQLYYKDSQRYAQKDFLAFAQLYYRKNIYNSHTLSLRYDHISITDTILDLNPNYSPGGQEVTRFLTLSYRFRSDHRDFKPYPLNGYFIEIEAGRQGFRFIDRGDLSRTYVQATFRKFWELSPRCFVATGLNGLFSEPGEQPYFQVRAIGYERDIVRGYEYYVIDGQNFTLWKNEFKFALIPRKEGEFRFIRTEKFRRIYYAIYLNAFADIGFVENRMEKESAVNDLQNTLLTGYGLGLDLVTYYDVVIRVEYSRNHLGEGGIFLHFRAPI